MATMIQPARKRLKPDERRAALLDAASQVLIEIRGGGYRLVK